MVNVDIRDLNVVSLAYLGDAAWSLCVREYFINQNRLVNDLHNRVNKYVNAKFQSKIYLEIIESVKPEFKAIANRARNAKINSFPKSCTKTEYRHSTAFEALIGCYYSESDIDFIKDLVNKYVKMGEENEGKS